jgi:hypothetical protein
MNPTAPSSSLSPAPSSPSSGFHRVLVRLGRDYAYVLPGFFISLIGFVLLVPLFAAAIGTAVVGLGVWLLPLLLVIATGFAGLSRSRARFWGARVPEPAYRTAGAGFNGPLRLIADPRRWLDLLFETLIAFPMRTVTFCLAVTWTAVAAGGLTYVWWGHYLPHGEEETHLVGTMLRALSDGAVPDAVADSYAVESLAYFVLGVLFSLALPVVMRGLALLDATATAAALGPEPASGPAQVSHRVGATGARVA